MTLMMYAVYDHKAKAYGQPKLDYNTATCLRWFSDLVNKDGHPWQAHPEDYTLFQLGEYDDQSGMILPLTTPTPIGKAVEYVKHT